MRAHRAVDRDQLLAPPRARVADRGNAADSILRLQRDAGNRAVAEVLQRENQPAKPPVGAAATARSLPNVPVIGPVPTAVAGLPKADPALKGQPLGETQVVGSTTPTFDVKPAPPPAAAAAGKSAKPAKSYTGQVQKTETGSIQIKATYPAPALYPVGSMQVIVGDDASKVIGAGEQEHSNDHHLAFHLVQSVVAGAINRLAAKPPHTGPDLEAVHAHWAKQLQAELPPQLRSADPKNWNKPASDLIAKLHDLSRHRDTSGSHNMAFNHPLAPQWKEYKVKKGTDLKRVMPISNIGEKGSQEKIDAEAAWLKKARR